MTFVDLDGKALRASTSNAQNLILNTLNSKDIPYISFDNEGNINKNMINSRTINSGNYQFIQEIVNNETMVDIKVDDSFYYKDENGTIQQRDMGAIIYEPNFIDGAYGSFKTEETGFLGIAQTPVDGTIKYNSPDNKVRITINSNASIKGQAQTLSHEMYGHTSLYLKGANHKHKFKGTTDTNAPLHKKVLDSTKETIENTKERENEN